MTAIQTSVDVTAAPNVIGYIVQAGNELQPTPVTAPVRAARITTTTSSNLMGYGGIQDPQAANYGYAVLGGSAVDDSDLMEGNLGDVLANYCLPNESGETSTERAVWPCSSADGTSIEIVETYPSGGETWTLFDCLASLRVVEPSVGTLYRTVSISTEIPITSLSDTETIVITSASQETSSTTSDGGGGNGGDGGEGSDAGIIVGAVVGSISGLAFLITIFCMGIRIGRKRAAAGKVGGIREAIKSMAWMSSSPGSGKTMSYPVEGKKDLHPTSVVNEVDGRPITVPHVHKLSDAPEVESSRPITVNGWVHPESTNMHQVPGSELPGLSSQSNIPGEHVRYEM